MRRDVAIALLVLIPVAILIALSLGGNSATEREQDPDPVLPKQFAVAVAKTVDAGSGSAAPQPVSPREEESAGLSAALIGNARQCLADQKNATSVEVHFTPTREGRYADVKVTTQDPYLAACLEDVFDEARWPVSPGATESFAPTKYTFVTQ